eukprot:scaffold3819_cov107-Isochrysis_galbana.AAC.8
MSRSIPVAGAATAVARSLGGEELGHVSLAVLLCERERIVATKGLGRGGGTGGHQLFDGGRAAVARRQVERRLLPRVARVERHARLHQDVNGAAVTDLRRSVQAGLAGGVDRVGQVPPIVNHHLQRDEIIIRDGKEGRLLLGGELWVWASRSEGAGLRVAKLIQHWRLIGERNARHRH